MAIKTAASIVVSERSSIAGAPGPKTADASCQQPSVGSGQLLTPPQVSNMLQVKLARIYELVKARRMRAVKVGRQLRFRLQDVEAFLDRSTTDRW
jgi:excisionase family DNA binding protein